MGENKRHGHARQSRTKCTYVNQVLLHWQLPHPETAAYPMKTCYLALVARHETARGLTTQAKHSLATEIRVMISLTSASEGCLLKLFLLEMSKYY